jgi:hypothetical protein
MVVLTEGHHLQGQTTPVLVWFETVSIMCPYCSSHLEALRGDLRPTRIVRAVEPVIGRSRWVSDVDMPDGDTLIRCAGCNLPWSTRSDTAGGSR